MNNQETARAWFTGSKESGKSNNGNLNFSGNVLRSYNTPIAIVLTCPDREIFRVTLYTSERYSVTTSGKHMPAMQRACGYTGYEVPGEVLSTLSRYCDAWSELENNLRLWDLIAAHYEEKTREADEKAKRARSDRMKTLHENIASEAVRVLSELREIFGKDQSNA